MTTYTYHANKANGQTLDGVPCRDLTEKDVENLTRSQRAAVNVVPFFIEDKPVPAPKTSGKEKGE
jgi:hypothetical protein